MLAGEQQMITIQEVSELFEKMEILFCNHQLPAPEFINKVVTAALDWLTFTATHPTQVTEQPSLLQDWSSYRLKAKSKIAQLNEQDPLLLKNSTDVRFCEYIADADADDNMAQQLLRSLCNCIHSDHLGLQIEGAPKTDIEQQHLRSSLINTHILLNESLQKHPHKVQVYNIMSEIDGERWSNDELKLVFSQLTTAEVEPFLNQFNGSKLANIFLEKKTNIYSEETKKIDSFLKDLTELNPKLNTLSIINIMANRCPESFTIITKQFKIIHEQITDNGLQLKAKNVFNAFYSFSLELRFCTDADGISDEDREDRKGLHRLRQTSALLLSAPGEERKKALSKYQDEAWQAKALSDCGDTVVCMRVLGLCVAVLGLGAILLTSLLGVSVVVPLLMMGGGALLAGAGLFADKGRPTKTSKAMDILCDNVNQQSIILT